MRTNNIWIFQKILRVIVKIITVDQIGFMKAYLFKQHSLYLVVYAATSYCLGEINQDMNRVETF